MSEAEGADASKIYAGRIARVTWQTEGGKLVLRTKGKLELEFPIEHFNTAKDLESHTGQVVEILVEGQKIAGWKLVSGRKP
jgi:hypothetical protein